MNAREYYINRFNSYEAMALADDKIYTKGALKLDGINTPSIIGVITNEADIDHIAWDKLPKEFVIKPSQGYKGAGILVLKRIRDGFWRSSRKKVWSKNLLKEHIRDVIDGTYSLHESKDTVLIEERLRPHPCFDILSPTGLPDIRLIMFKLVPLMAMLRLPTKGSGGLANLAQGAIGLGLDLATGTVTSGIHGHKPFTLPPQMANFRFEQWPEILEIAGRCQAASNLAFMGADLTIDRKMGVTVLELNARPGLEIQNANMLPLRSRIEQVKDLQIRSVREGIEIAKKFFCNSKRSLLYVPQKQVLASTEEAVLVSLQGTLHKVIARIDTGAERTSLDIELAKSIGVRGTGQIRKYRSAAGEENRELAKLTYFLSGRKIDSIVSIGWRQDLKHPMIVGRSDLKGFYVDPTAKNEAAIDEANVLTADRALARARVPLGLLSRLRPLNAKEEKKRFFESGYMQNPQFVYPEFEVDLAYAAHELEAIDIDISRSIGVLLEEKRRQSRRQIDLLRTVQMSDLKQLWQEQGSKGGLDEFQAKSFTKASLELFGGIDSIALQAARDELKNYKPKNEKRGIKAKEIKARFQSAIEESGLENWTVDLRCDMVSDFATTIGKKRVFYVRHDLELSSVELEKAIVHEIYTHAFRMENALRQPYLALRNTANYLSAEEGLALYNERLVSTGYTEKFFLPIFYLLATKKALKFSFVEVFAYLRELGLSEQYAWSVTLKVKRGIRDTSLPGAFTKDANYWSGYLDVSKYVSSGGELTDLYYGKIGLQDVAYVRDNPSLQKPKYLPPFYAAAKKR